MHRDAPAMQESSVRDRDYRPIRDYAFIGDCHGAALVASNGSIDWCCLERFDALPIFSRLLDRQREGFFQIAPAAGAQKRRRCRYRPETNVLETVCEADGNAARIVDFMPVQRADDAGEDDYTRLKARHWLVRIVEGVQGSMPIEAFYRPMPGYAQTFPELDIGGGQVTAADCPPLTSQTDFSLEDGLAVSRFDIAKGERRIFVLGERVPPVEDLEAAVEECRTKTEGFWTSWSECVSYYGPYRSQVLRSSLVLKALTYAPTGAFVAAATTSLPEEIGGVRNWDYRFCWLRDSCFAL